MKLRQVRFAARVHFLDACINAITFTDVGQTRGQTMVNGTSCAMCSSCRLLHPLARAGGLPAAASLRTRSAGIGARHAPCRGRDLGSRHGGAVPRGTRRPLPSMKMIPLSFLSSPVRPPSCTATRAPRARAGASRQRGPHAGRGQHARRHGGGREPPRRRRARGGGRRARRGSTWVRFSAGADLYSNQNLVHHNQPPCHLGR